MYIRAVDELHPVLVIPEVLRDMHSLGSIRRANSLVRLLKTCVSSLDDAELDAALRSSLGHHNALGRMGRRVLERADRLPVPLLPQLDGLRILTSAAEITGFGVEMDNCAASYVCEVALGLKLLGAYTYTGRTGETMQLALVFGPLIGGGWKIVQILGRGNEPVPKPILRTVLRRLTAIGVQVSGPALGGNYDRDVAELLGYHSFDRHCDTLRGALVSDDEDVPVESDHDEVVIALRRLAALA